MNTANPQPYRDDDEISLKELILKLREFYWEILRRWKWMILPIGLFVALFVYRAFSTPTTFQASMTFMINENEAGGGSEMNAILGQFGLNTGGGEYNLFKIVELAKSRRIIREVLFEKGTINGKSDYFANHLIASEQLHKRWKKDTTGLKNFFFKSGDRTTFKKTEKRAFKTLSNLVKGSPNGKVEGLVASSFNEDTGIITIRMKTQSSQLAILFLEVLYQKVSAFYKKEATEKSRLTYEKLKSKQDSLKQLFNSKEYQLAKAIDSNIGLVTKSGRLRLERLKREVDLLGYGYKEVLQNTERADFSLKNALPFFQIIDEPLSPLSPKRESKVRAIIMGAFIGGFLSVLFIIFRKIIIDAMKEED